jgi:hypothetical protein
MTVDLLVSDEGQSNLWKVTVPETVDARRAAPRPAAAMTNPAARHNMIAVLRMRLGVIDDCGHLACAVAAVPPSLHAYGRLWRVPCACAAGPVDRSAIDQRAVP